MHRLYFPVDTASAILPSGRAADVRPNGVDAPPARTAAVDPPHSTAQARRPKPSGPADRLKDVRGKLDQVARDMSAGKITSREQPAGDVKPADPKGVSDSLAIAPSPANPAAQSPAPAKKEPTAEEKTALSEKAKKVATAKRALALDGWKPERIAKFDDDELVEIGEHRAKNQADVNREYARLKAQIAQPRHEDGTFAKNDGDAKPAPAKAADDPAPAPAAAPPKPAQRPSALMPQVKALIEAKRQEIGDAGADLIEQIAGVLMAHTESRVGEGGQRAQSAEAVMTEMLHSQGWQTLEKDYSEELTADPEAFNEVAENFQALIASGRYGRGQISKAWRDAGYLKFGAPDSVAKAQRDMLARQEAADVGRVDPGAGSTTATTDAPLSHKDSLKLAGKMMAENPSANPDKLKSDLMTRVRGHRAVA